MHTAAAAAVYSSRLSPYLGEGLVDGHAFGKGMAMPAVGASHIIFFRKMSADSSRYSFFSHVQMDESGHHARAVSLLNSQFKLSHPLHAAIQRRHEIT